MTPTAFFDDSRRDGWEGAATFVDRVMREFGLGGRWAYHAEHGGGRHFGMTATELHALYGSAALLINLHGATRPRPEHAAGGPLVLVETDPVELETQLASGDATALEYAGAHSAFFTFGENIGRDECGLPATPGFEFIPTRQPVVLDLWDGLGLDDGSRTHDHRQLAPATPVGVVGRRALPLEQAPRVLPFPRPSRADRSDLRARARQLRRRRPGAARAQRLGYAAALPDGRLDRGLPALHRFFLRRVHGGERPEHPAAHGLVQRPQRDLPRRGTARRHPGHRVRIGAPDRQRPVRVLDRRRSRGGGRGDSIELSAAPAGGTRDFARVVLRRRRPRRHVAFARRVDPQGADCEQAVFRTSGRSRHPSGLASPA